MSRAWYRSAALGAAGLAAALTCGLAATSLEAAAPPIAGMAGWSDADALKFLQTGLAPGGKRAAPPMPWYRFSRSDAEALLAYLRSLAPAAGKPADK